VASAGCRVRLGAERPAGSGWPRPAGAATSLRGTRSAGRSRLCGREAGNLSAPLRVFRAASKNIGSSCTQGTRGKSSQWRMPCFDCHGRGRPVRVSRTSPGRHGDVWTPSTSVVVPGRHRGMTASRVGSMAVEPAPTSPGMIISDAQPQACAQCRRCGRRPDERMRLRRSASAGLSAAGPHRERRGQVIVPMAGTRSCAADGQTMAWLVPDRPHGRLCRACS